MLRYPPLQNSAISSSTILDSAGESVISEDSDNELFDDGNVNQAIENNWPFFQYDWENRSSFSSPFSAPPSPFTSSLNSYGWETDESIQSNSFERFEDSVVTNNVMFNDLDCLQWICDDNATDMTLQEANIPIESNESGYEGTNNETTALQLFNNPSVMVSIPNDVVIASENINNNNPYVHINIPNDFEYVGSNNVFYSPDTPHSIDDYEFESEFTAITMPEDDDDDDDTTQEFNQNDYLENIQIENPYIIIDIPTDFDYLINPHIIINIAEQEDEENAVILISDDEDEVIVISDDEQ